MISREKLTEYHNSVRYRWDGDLADLLVKLAEAVKTYGPEGMGVSLAWMGERGWKLVVDRPVSAERGR